MQYIKLSNSVVASLTSFVGVILYVKLQQFRKYVLSKQTILHHRNLLGYFELNNSSDSKYFVNCPSYWPLQFVLDCNLFIKFCFGGEGFMPINEKTFENLINEIDQDVHESFGSQSSFHRGLALFYDGLKRNYFLGGMAHLGLNSFVKSSLLQRKKVFTYVSNNPDVLNQNIGNPLVIMGLNRSGTTLLYNLLHTDLNSRSPFFYEIYGEYDHFPPATSRAAQYTDPRVKKIKDLFQLNEKLFPILADMQAKCHEVLPDSIEEDVIICEHQHHYFTHVPLVKDNGEFNRFILEPNKDYVYKYLKIYLQILQTGYTPQSHWTLKSPSHMLHLNCLINIFPGAKMIVCHRDPSESIPSFCYLIESVFGCYWESNTWDRRNLGTFVTELYKEMTERMMVFRDEHTELESQFIDIRFSDLIANPVRAVTIIYSKYGLEMPTYMPNKMNEYLAKNKMHKHGKPATSLEEYGLIKEVLDVEFSRYKDRFL